MAKITVAISLVYCIFLLEILYKQLSENFIVIPLFSVVQNSLLEFEINYLGNIRYCRSVA